MQMQQVHDALGTWPTLSGLVYVSHTAGEYERLVALLDRLIDEVGEDEAHPLASLMEVVGVLIAGFEDRHVPELIADCPLN